MVPVLTALVMCLLLATGFGKPAHAANVPAGFTDSRVAQVDSPTAMAFTPDGRMLIASRPGQLRVHKGGKLLQGSALNIAGKVCDNSERGLLGLAVDPKFATNHYIYIYYTYNKHGVCPVKEPTNPKNPVNVVERYELSDNNVATFSKRLINNIPSPNGNHNAGDLHFGKDNYLYASVGDGSCDYAEPTKCQYENDASRDRNILLGKILRITRDGGIPPDNPYAGGNSGRCGVTGRTAAKNCKETYAIGLRNPFRMAFDPDASDTKFRINDVGGGRWEEIDAGKKGADYAWNICEGRHDNPYRGGSVNCTAAPYTPPIHEYSHDTGCSSITGGAFVPDRAWPTSYNRSYLYGDYVCGKIFNLTPKSGGGYTRTTFMSGLGRGGPVHMAFGPYGRNQALYYATYTNGGEIRRVSHSTSVNKAPTARVTADPTYGTLPLKVTFDASRSSDPNGEPLTYLWDFGDGTKGQTTTPSTTHEYTSGGTNTAVLKVQDNHGVVSAPREIKLYPGNMPPEPTFAAPASDFRFTVGEDVALSASATDPEDGPVPGTRLKWEVLQHHNASHTHPYDSGTGDSLTIKAPPPEELEATDPEENYLEVKLTATDSSGLSKTITRRLEPKVVDLTFDTDPSGLKLEVNGSRTSAPRTITSWVGYVLNVKAPEQLDGDGRTQGNASWSDGGAAAHRITTPTSPATYTATFKALPAKTVALSVTLSRTLVPYGGTVSLTGKLSTPSGPVAGKRLELWRSLDRGRNWSLHGRMVYDSSSRNYRVSRSLTRNTLYQMRFAGDSSYKKVTSGSVSVRSRAYLSRPVAPSVVKKGSYFTVHGYLKPYHAGKTKLNFYHYRGGKWRFYKTVYAPNRPYNGSTKYVRRYKVPHTGLWYVRAYHHDGSHAFTRSPAETFRVRR